MKTFFSIFCMMISLCVYSQDEYGQPKPLNPTEIETQDRSTRDSIKIINQPEAKKEVSNSDSKAYKGQSNFVRNLRFGGGLIAFSDYEASINTQIAVLGISPQITSKLNDYFEGGIATSYLYQGSFGDANLHAIGVGPIMRAYPFEGYFLQVEGQLSHLNSSVRGFETFKGNYFNAFVGGGWMSEIGENSYIITGLKVNLIKNALTRNEIFPVAFTSIHFGFGN
jgi:hypothetical protein